MVDYTRYISGGYLIVREGQRTWWMSGEFVPDTILTPSDCLCHRIPDAWTLNWTQFSPEERRQSAARFAVPAHRLDELGDWVTAHFADKTVGWPGIFLSLDLAREFMTLFLPPSTQSTILGIGLNSLYVDEFLSCGDFPPTIIGPGCYTAVRQKVGLPDGGTPLGFDVLGIENGGSTHSWLCHNVTPAVYQEYGTRPNSSGLLETLEGAQQCAEYIARPDVGAERVPWLPWLVVQYPKA